jgi:hypothetical protein
MNLLVVLRYPLTLPVSGPSWAVLSLGYTIVMDS